MEGKVEVFVFEKGFALPIHPGANVVTRPTVPPRVVGVGDLKPFSAFTSTMCREELVSTDCPPGWACCGIQELEEGFGRCAVTCAISPGTFLSRRSLPKLTASIGEGSNHSNFSDWSSVRIVSEFRKIC